jgi:hypothetical protein
MDELTALFANKPTSYLGDGIIYNGDTRGNGVSSTELDVVVIPRGAPDSSGGTFKGLWYPKKGASDTQVIITGGSIFDGTTLHTVADATLSVHATSLNYIYLACDLTKTTVDSYVSGGTVDATPTIATSTSAASLTNSNIAGHILLCTWQAGALVDRYAYFAFACELLQKRSGSVGDVTFNWWSY